MKLDDAKQEACVLPSGPSRFPASWSDPNRSSNRNMRGKRFRSSGIIDPVLAYERCSTVLHLTLPSGRFLKSSFGMQF